MTERRSGESKNCTKVEKLAGLGGFIEEAVRDYLEEEYSPEIISLVEKYMSVGAGISYVADEVRRTGKRVANASFCFSQDMSDNDLICSVLSDGYFAWYMEQTAKWAAQNYGTAKWTLWKGWRVDSGSRKALLELSSFEQRILCLYQGLEDGEYQSEEMIAEREEFACDPRYISNVIELIWSIFEAYSADREHFEELCAVCLLDRKETNVMYQY